MRVLFVSNGHGEAAIADRIAAELHAVTPDAQLDHLALVGDPVSDSMRPAGPRRAMPSGGLIAMGNVGNLVRDLSAGLLPLLVAQRRFLHSIRGRYDVAVTVGDVYALAMTLRARAPTIFVGTAKSVDVAPYGRLEERVLAHADVRYVRDDATAQRLRKHGLAVEPAANVIVDLFVAPPVPQADAALAGFDPALVLFPGSRANAYDDAAFLLRVVREIAARFPRAGAALSIARGLDAARFATTARRDGWDVNGESRDGIAFRLSLQGRTIVHAWTEAPAPLLKKATLVLGQAGTANEGAAAAGVPVVAFQRDRDGKARWYRKRQQGLLGDAMALFDGSMPEAAASVADLLNDAARRARMSEAGRARMGAPGGLDALPRASHR